VQRVQAISVAYNNGQPVEIVTLDQEPNQDTLDPSKIYWWTSLGVGRGHSWAHAEQQAADTAGKVCGYYGARSGMGDTLEAMLELLGVTLQPAE
jgi:hypothetical protein